MLTPLPGKTICACFAQLLCATAVRYVRVAYVGRSHIVDQNNNK
jgi:hypothetical protein